MSRGQRRAERGSGRGEREHRRTQHGRHGRRCVHRAASASRRRHGEPAASESAAARRAQRRSRAPRRRWLEPRSAASRARVGSEESTSTGERSTGAMGDAACIAQRVRAAAGMASRRRARAPPRGRAQRRSRAPRRRWLEPRSAASIAGLGRVEESTSTDERSTGAMATLRASRSECEPPPAWRAGGERERRRAASAATQPSAEAALA